MHLSAPRSLRRFGSRRTLLRIAIAVFVLAALWSAAWFYVPPIVAAQAVQGAQRELGRRLAIGRVTFNPWTLELTLADVALAGAAAGAPPLFETTRVGVDSCLTGHLVCDLDTLVSGPDGERRDDIVNDCV